MYGKSYLKLNASETDELCQWVYDTREKGLKLGDDETGPNYLINTSGYCMTTPAAHIGVALCNIRCPRALIIILGTSGLGSDKTRNEGNGNEETEIRKWKLETEMRKLK